MITKEKFRQIADQIFSMATADEVEVLLSSDNSSLTRFANNTIHQNVSSSDDSVRVRVVTDGKVGTASFNRFEPEVMRKSIESAEAVMKLGKPDPEYLEMQGATEVQEGLQRYFLETARFGPIDRANIVGHVVEKCTEHGAEASGILSNGESCLGLANNKGLFQYDISTGSKFSLTASADGVSGWAEQGSKNIESIDFEKLTDKAIDTLLKAKNPISIEPGKYTVVMPPEAVASFLLYLSWMGFGPISYHRGISPLSGKIGSQVFGKNISLVDDFTHPLSLGMPFDFDGSPRTTVPLVEDGIMTGMVYDRKSALKYGAAPTGHGLPQPNNYGAFPGNLVMKAGDSSLEKMIAGTKYGIYVTHFHYTNVVKPSDLTLTGMTRDGVFLIENGKITKALKNFRYTDSIFNLLNNVVEISEERQSVGAFFGGSFVVPALKVKDFHFTSGTDF